MYRGPGYYKDKAIGSPWSPYPHPAAKEEWLNWHAEHPSASDEEIRQFSRDLEFRYNRCPGCGAHPSEPLRGWCLVEDPEDVAGAHLWDGHFWVPCAECNAKGCKRLPGASPAAGQRKAAPAASPAGAACDRAHSCTQRAQTLDDDHCNTKGEKRQLAALVFYRCVTSDPAAVHPQKMDDSPGVKSAYRLVKLYDDGQAEPVADGRIDEAINFVIARGWKREAFGYWINGAQALVWTQHPWEFEHHWAAPLMRCPARYTRNVARYESKSYVGRLVRVGVEGCIAPTRTGRQVVALRSRFPTFSGDALWAPVEVMEAEQRQEEELAQRLAGSRLFARSAKHAAALAQGMK